MRPILLVTLLLPALFTACGTATHVPVVSYPEGARIFVDGVDTGQTTPATIDIERYAPDPDRPMTVEARLPGFVPTMSPPYEARHRCGQWVCPKKQRHQLPCHLPLLRSGSGIRIDTRRAGYEARIDEGPWQPIDGPAMRPEAAWGVTLPAEPGVRTFGWRPRDPAVRRSFPEQARPLLVPAQGYVAIDFDLSPIHKVQGGRWIQ